MKGSTCQGQTPSMGEAFRSGRMDQGMKAILATGRSMDLVG